MLKICISLSAAFSLEAKNAGWERVGDINFFFFSSPKWWLSTSYFSSYLDMLLNFLFRPHSWKDCSSRHGKKSYENCIFAIFDLSGCIRWCPAILAKYILTFIRFILTVITDYTVMLSMGLNKIFANVFWSDMLWLWFHLLHCFTCRSDVFTFWLKCLFNFSSSSY